MTAQRLSTYLLQDLDIKPTKANFAYSLAILLVDVKGHFFWLLIILTLKGEVVSFYTDSNHLHALYHLTFPLCTILLPAGGIQKRTLTSKDTKTTSFWNSPINWRIRENSLEFFTDLVLHCFSIFWSSFIIWLFDALTTFILSSNPLILGCIWFEISGLLYPKIRWHSDRPTFSFSQLFCEVHLRACLFPFSLSSLCPVPSLYPVYWLLSEFLNSPDFLGIFLALVVVFMRFSCGVEIVNVGKYALVQTSESIK